MLLSIFLIIAILVDVKWCPMVVLICISLMTSFYMLIACLYIFFGKIFIQILCSLKIQLCFNCYSIQVLLYILDSKCLSDKCFWKNFIFFPFCGLFFFFLLSWWCPLKQKFLVCWNPIYIYFSFVTMLLVLYLRRLCQTKGHKDLSVHFLQRVIVLALIHRSVIHLC